MTTKSIDLGFSMFSALSLLLLLAIGLAVLLPLWRPALELPADPVGPAAELANLHRRKLNLYSSIRELGFDFRSGKLSHEDYEEGVERLKAEAIAVVRQIARLEAQPPRGPQRVERRIAAARAQLSRPEPAVSTKHRDRTQTGRSFCNQCGQPVAATDRFCASCGTEFREPS